MFRSCWFELFLSYVCRVLHDHGNSLSCPMFCEVARLRVVVIPCQISFVPPAAQSYPVISRLFEAVGMRAMIPPSNVFIMKEA